MEVACNNCGWEGAMNELRATHSGDVCPDCYEREYLADIS